jgi:DNA-binding XRE family transcriptional regulator
MKNNIKKYREEKGLTQKELAEMAKVSKWWINKVENGTAEPGIKALVKIASSLEISVADLFSKQIGENRQKGDGENE